MPTTMGNKVLRDLRAATKMSQRAAAKRAGVSPIQWAQVETGEKSFGTAGWLKIWDAYHQTLRALGYSCADLLRGHRKPGPRAAAA